VTRHQGQGKRRPTITDVAALAGVSKGAVSRSFNGGRRISLATRERIRAAATQLGWEPSAAARAVNGAPAHAIGVVLRRPAELLELDPFFPAFLAGVESVLAVHSYAAILRFVRSAADERACYHQMFAERRVDGFLLNDLRRADRRLRLVRELGAPAVLVGDPGPECPFPSIDTESAEQLRALIEHLIAAGHTRIAHVTGAAELMHSKARHELWRRTLLDHGLEPGPVVVGNFAAQGGAEATRELLATSPRPTAIFYGNDVMAIAGMAVLAEHGLRVPQDVAIAGFDDISIASYVTPALSTVHCNYRRLGRTAAETLLEVIAGRPTPARCALPSEVRLRQSTGHPGPPGGA
jgi:DNA-binding LacI/PurR family transcriptional regulator